MSDRDTRLKRLRIRSWRRGTKEMDLILGAFFDARGDQLDDADLDLYEALLSENDQDLYQWFSQQVATPAAHERILRKLRQHHASNTPTVG